MKHYSLFQIAFCLLVFLSCDMQSTPDLKVAMTAQVNPTSQSSMDTEAANWSRAMNRDTSANDMFPTLPLSKYDSIFSYNPDFFSDGFDYPVGIPDGNGYFIAQNFGDDQHLGEDWNARTGGNTDFGDPVFAISDGLVTFSREVCCGWGNVIRVVHYLPNHPEHKYIESVYAHLHNKFVRPGQLIKRGEKIGTIGNAHGRYTAHLHLELRSFINMSLGPGYSEDTFGFLIPSDFIKSFRP